MIRLVIACTFLMIFSLVAVKDADAFRCSVSLVKIGDTKLEVLKKCGEPTMKDSWDEEYVSSQKSSTYKHRKIIKIDEWTYNFGPNKFIQILRFEKGKLVNIKSGGYGY